MRRKGAEPFDPAPSTIGGVLEGAVNSTARGVDQVGYLPMKKFKLQYLRSYSEHRTPQKCEVRTSKKFFNLSGAYKLKSLPSNFLENPYR